MGDDSRGGGTPDGLPIQVVANRTGLTPDVLRAWERRYQVVDPARTDTGRRLYSEAEVQRLLLLRRATLAGRRISDVASLGDEQLRRMVQEDEAAAARRPGPPGPAGGGDPESRRKPASPVQDVSTHMERCRQCIRQLDASGLEQALRAAGLDLGRPRLLQEVMVPLVLWIGEAWRDGDLRVAHEHLASAVARTYLGSLTAGGRLPRGAPRLLVTTLPGQQHELGALIIACLAEIEGWRVVYLGPDLPAEDIATAARETGASAVALSLVYPAQDPGAVEELLLLADYLDEEVTLLAGGRVADSYADTLEDVGARTFPDLDAFRRFLRDGGAG